MIKEEVENISRVNVFAQGRIIYFFSEVNPESICETFKLLQILEEHSKKPIQFIISSPGGDVYSGLALYDRIMISPCKITMIGTGIVASMGLIIFFAGKERIITANTTLLSHQNTMDLNSGKTADVKIEAKEMERLEHWTINMIAEKTGQSAKKIKEEIKLGDKYISSTEALKRGFCHKII